jgi:hypothetical protein
VKPHLGKNDAVGDLEWIISVDSSVVRAHQHSAGPAAD